MSSEIGLNPTQFPILSAVTDDVTFWVVVNNQDYQVTMAQLRAVIGGAEGSGAGGVTEAQLAAAIAHLVTSQQLEDAINGVAPVDLPAAIEAYFQQNPVPTPNNVVTFDNLSEQQVIVMLSETLESKIGETQLLEALSSKADVTALQGLATEEFVTNAIAAIPPGVGGVTEAQLAEAVQGLASEEFVTNAIAAIPPAGNGISQEQLDEALALKADLSAVQGLASEEFVNTAISAIQAAEGVTEAQLDERLADYVMTGTLNAVTTEINEQLSAKATQTAVEEGLALKADLTALEGLASEAFVNNAIAAIPPAGNGISQEQLDEALALKADASALATLSEVVDGKANASALEGLASEAFVTNAIAALPAATGVTQEQLDVALGLKANESDLQELTLAHNALVDVVATKADASALQGLATETFVTEAIAAIPAPEGVTQQQLLDATQGLATEAFVTNAIAAIPSNEGVTEEQLTQAVAGLASTTYVTENFVSIPDFGQALSGKANASDVQDLATQVQGLATQEALNNVSALLTNIDFTPTNYTPANATLLAHLQAIDAALGALMNPGDDAVT